MAMAEQKTTQCSKAKRAFERNKNTNTKRTGLVCVDQQSRG
jgi:hypothetical protein